MVSMLVKSWKGKKDLLLKENCTDHVTKQNYVDVNYIKKSLYICWNIMNMLYSYHIEYNVNIMQMLKGVWHEIFNFSFLLISVPRAPE